MLKIRVNEELELIKTKLSPIRDKVCIVHNRRNKDVIIVTSREYFTFVQTHLSVVGVEDFTEEDKFEFFLSNEDILMIGRADFMQ